MVYAEPNPILSNINQLSFTEHYLGSQSGHLIFSNQSGEQYKISTNNKNPSEVKMSLNEIPSIKERYIDINKYQ